MNKRKLEELQGYYDNTDLSDQLSDEKGHWETEVVEDPMIGISLRLPKSLLDKVREEAERRSVPYSVLVRGWVEAGLSQLGEGTDPGALHAILRRIAELDAEIRKAGLAA